MPQSRNDSHKGKRSVTITDHAVIRYIERVAGISLDSLRASIASGGNIKPADVSDLALCRHIESVGEISLSFIRSEIHHLTKAALATRATGVMIENHFGYPDLAVETRFSGCLMILCKSELTVDAMGL